MNIHPAITLDHVSIISLATFELDQLQGVSTLRRTVLAIINVQGTWGSPLDAPELP